MLSPQSLHYDPPQCLQNHALPRQSLPSVKFASFILYFLCLVLPLPALSQLSPQDPTHDHTHNHNTSSPTGLLQLSPKLLYLTMQCNQFFHQLPWQRRQLDPQKLCLHITNQRGNISCYLTMLCKSPTTKLTCSSLTFCYALGVDCDSLSVICSYCGACLRYGCSDWNCNKMC